MDANKEIIDTYIYLENERLQIRKKTESPVICKIKMPTVWTLKKKSEEKMSFARSVQGLCQRGRSMNSERQIVFTEKKISLQETRKMQ